MHISETTRVNFTKFSVHVARALGRGSVLFWRRRLAIRCTSGFVDDVMFSHNGPYGGVTYRSSLAAVS